MVKWYVVHTLVHGEQRAEDHLGRQDFNVWLPLYQKTIRHAGRRKTVLRPLFPRYLFVSLDLSSDQWRKILSTRGVKTLLTVDSDPLSVPNEIIDGLRSHAAADGLFVVRPTGLRQGEKVKILDGPFTDLEAVFAAQRDEDRVLVLLNLLGRQTTVQISSKDVERI